MGLIIFPRRSRLKPVKPVLNPASPLAEGLLLYVCFDGEGGSGVSNAHAVRELVTGRPFQGSNGGAQSVGEFGPAIRNTNGGGSNNLALSPSAYALVFPDPDRITVASRLFTSGGGGRQTIYSPDDVANGAQVEVDDGASTFTVNSIINGTFIAQSSTTGPAKTWVSVIYVRRGSGATSEIWINGLKATLSTNVTNAFANVGAQVQRVGHRSAGAQSLLGSMEYCGVWGRDLLPTEIMELVADPYQVLKTPGPRLVQFTAPATAAAFPVAHTFVGRQAVQRASSW